MKAWLLKNKTWLILVVCIVLAGGTVAGVVMSEWLKNPANKEVEAIQYSYQSIETKAMPDSEDVGVMLADCDEKAHFQILNGGRITHREGQYVQGTGAVRIDSIYSDNAANASIEETDISEYKNGSIHVSLYVGTPERYSGKMLFELTSSGGYDEEELCWEIPIALFHAGWNELYLGMDDAIKTGEIDLNKVNYFRIFTYGGDPGFDIILDNIYATHTEGMSLIPSKNIQTASTKEGMLLDCDTLEGVESPGKLSLSTATGEYKEGVAGYYLTNLDKEWLRANIETVDLTKYEYAQITFWIFVNDARYIKDGSVCLELTSSGTHDQNEMCWVFPGSELKTGWNLVKLHYPSSWVTPNSPIDLKNVNFLRLHGDGFDSKLAIFLDAFTIGPAPRRVAEDGMIYDCDSMDNVKVFSYNDYSITTAAGEYQEGTGALKSVGTNADWWQCKFEELVDISAYKDGGLQMWLYISDPNKLTSTVNIELGSGGSYDADEYEWRISGLKAGWNKVQLEFSNAQEIQGEPNLTSINWFRAYSFTEGEITTIVDEVRAINIGKKENTDGMILDCDRLDGVTSSGVIGLSKGEYKEGTGAFYIANPDLVWISANLKPIDLSTYERGQISFWLYVNDANYVKSGSVVLELTSSGVCDVNEMCWEVKGDKLESGWNQVKLPFPSNMVSSEPIDLTKINFLRIYGEKCDKNLEVILDAIMIGDAPKRVAEDGVIYNCDSMDNVSVLSYNNYSITTAGEEYKEGTGALKSVGTSADWWQCRFDELVDISAYENEGIHMWLYISDASKLTSAVCIELGSGGTWDADEYEWSVFGLQSGWNELYLKFADAQVAGTPDLANINWFRTYAFGEGELTTIIDDVRAVQVNGNQEGDDSDGEQDGEQGQDKEPVEGMLFDCDTFDDVIVDSGNKPFDVTTIQGEYKEGTGAYKSAGSDAVRWICKPNEAIDISKYNEGGLHLWLYVSDAAKLTSAVNIELGSAGECDKNEYEWHVSGLQTGWNELYLKFSEAPDVAGTPNLTSINWFRIYAFSDESITVMLDDVRAVKNDDNQEGDDSDGEQDGDQGQDKEPIEGMLFDCDTFDGVIVDSGNKPFDVTTVQGEYKEGTGAYKSAGSDVVRWICKPNEAIDISKYNEGGLHLWLYVSDAAKLTSAVNIELGSAGECDKNEYEWHVSGLQTGWNELYLKFSEAPDVAGTPDLKSINWFRIYAFSDESVAIMMDDVRAVTGAEEKKVTLFNCDTFDGFIVDSGNKPFAVTTTAGEFKEGTGAYKSAGSDVVRWICKPNEAINILECSTGSLKLWVYISDTTKLTSTVNIELGSAGECDKNEYEWAVSGLTTGWNEVTLDFADQNIVKTGTLDFTNINWFRMYAFSSADITVIMDDVRAVKN